MQQIRSCSQPDSIRRFPDPICAAEPPHEFRRVAVPVEGCMDRKLKQQGGDRAGCGCSHHHPGDPRVDAGRHPESKPYLEHEPNAHRRYHKGLDPRLLRSVIGRESIAGDKMPGLIVDETLHAIRAEAVGIEENDCEDECLLKA